jgi:hypothetical protein
MSEPFEPRVTPWHIDHAEFHDLQSFAEQMRFLLRYAVLAPSGHNTQPWAFRVTRTGVEVFADYSKRLPAIDPQDRELHMSIGASITNFRVAAAHFGFNTILVYDRTTVEGVPLAVITAVETCAPSNQGLESLFRAIPRRHTNHAPFDGGVIDPRTLSRLRTMIMRFPHTFRLIRPEDKRRVAQMIEQAGRARMGQPAFRAEIVDWIRASDSRQTHGISAAALGVPDVFGAAWLLRRFNFGEWRAPRDRRLSDSASMLVLVTAEDDRVSLIGAGEALEQLLLTITDLDLQYSFLNHPVALDSMRDRIRAIAGASHPAQLLIRIGFARAVEQAMPRQKVDKVIEPA